MVQHKLDFCQPDDPALKAWLQKPTPPPTPIGPSLKEGAVGCLTSNLLSEFLTHATNNDTRAIAEMIADQDCYMFKSGVEVYARDRTYGMRLVKIRGTGVSLWFVKEDVLP